MGRSSNYQKLAAAKFRAAVAERQMRYAQSPELFDENPTQKNLARAIGIGQAYMSRILAGSRTATVDVMAKINALRGFEGVMPPFSAEGGIGEPAASVPVAARALGCQSFMDRHAARLHITQRERLALESSRFNDSFVIQDDVFWEMALAFWRRVFLDQDNRPAVPALLVEAQVVRVDLCSCGHLVKAHTARGCLGRQEGPGSQLCDCRSPAAAEVANG